MSTIVIRLLMFLLPFLIFWMVLRLVRSRKTKEGALDERTERLLGRASLMGIIFLIVTIIYVFSTSEDNTEMKYVPPQEVDGVIQPGHFEEVKSEDLPDDNVTNPSAPIGEESTEDSEVLEDDDGDG